MERPEGRRSCESSRHRLHTPRHGTRERSRSRSRSPMSRPGRSRSRVLRRNHSPVRAGPSRVIEPDPERAKMLEIELLRERRRLLDAEQRASQRRASEQRAPLRPASEQRAPLWSASEQCAPLRSASEQIIETPRRAEHRDHAGNDKRSRSPSISRKDFCDVFKCLKDGLSAHPSVGDARAFPKVDHGNMVPNFDPSKKNQRIDIWIRKVNECASVYGWDDKTTTHFAMQKLQGLAKTWYEGLNSVMFTWIEWQNKLSRAFPYEQNYGQILEEMLKRRSKHNEPIEVYYYEKLALLNQCDIEGKRAADCIIHGITDRNLKSSALALRCTHPDQLLQFLISSKDSNQFFDRHLVGNKDNISGSSNQFVARPGLFEGCYNCKEKGHSYLHCPKPIIKCVQCNRIGHLKEKCPIKNTNSIVN